MTIDQTLGGFIAGVIIGSAITIVAFNGRDTATPPPFEDSLGRIDIGDVSRLRAEYDANTTFPLMTKYIRSGGAVVVEKLQGFKFDADDLIELATTNHSTLGTHPDSVIFFIGQEGTFQDNSTPPITYPKINLIGIGFKNGRLFTGATSELKASLFDKADPCPPNCPR